MAVRPATGLGRAPRRDAILARSQRDIREAQGLRAVVAGQ